MLTPARLRLLCRLSFLVYVPALFVATHWPALEVPGEGRPDLLVHVAVFALWTSLLIGAGFFGPALSWRNILIVLPIAIAWAAFDEATQAIPFVRRHAAIDDFLANLVGILLACLAGLVLMTIKNRMTARPSRRVTASEERAVSK